MLQHTIRESRRLIYTTTSALRLLVVILCYPGAFAPSAPRPDPTSGVSGVFELEVQRRGAERQPGRRGKYSRVEVNMGSVAQPTATLLA